MKRPLRPSHGLDEGADEDRRCVGLDGGWQGGHLLFSLRGNVRDAEEVRKEGGLHLPPWSFFVNEGVKRSFVVFCSGGRHRYIAVRYAYVFGK